MMEKVAVAAGVILSLATSAKLIAETIETVQRIRKQKREEE